MTLDLSTNARRLIIHSEAGDELAAFAEWLSAERYSTFVIERHLRRLAFVAPKLSYCPKTMSHSEARLRTVFDAQCRPRSRFHCFAGTRRAYQRYLLNCGRLAAAPPSRFSELRREYAEFVVDVRGLSVSSRRQHSNTVEDFLLRGLRPRQLLKSLSRADVERFVLLRSREVSRHSLQHVVAYVRAFLRFVHDRGLIATRLDALDTPRTYRDELPPRAVPWPMVEQLLASIDLSSKSGPRDHCILHLIAHYGLRPSEVVTLRVDSIDWQKKLLRVEQTKTRSVLILPLAAPTLKVLKTYLRDRAKHPSEHTFLFRRARCPYIPLERTAVADILAKRALAAGLTEFGKNPYRLRHTLAMRLLTRGVGVKAIGDVLGHRSLASTVTYLRLDVATLRPVALSVPVVAEAGVHHA